MVGYSFFIYPEGGTLVGYSLFITSERGTLVGVIPCLCLPGPL